MEIPLERISANLADTFLCLVEAETVPRPGAPELLDHLYAAGIPAAIVSASPRSIVDVVLRALGPHLFTTTVADGEADRSKPHPEPYLVTAQNLGVDPTRCLAIEDSPVGLASAEAAGCRVIAIPSVLPIDPVPGRMILGDLHEVPLRL